MQAIDKEALEPVAGSDAALAELRGVAGDCAAAVVMPSPCIDLPRATARNVPSCAIVRLESGPVWLLKVLGYWWSTPRLITAARVLQHYGNALQPSELNDRLCEELELPGVSASRPGAADFDGSAWSVRRVAVAIHLARAFSAAPAHPAPLTSADVAAVVERMTAQLALALRRFQSGLDSEAMRQAARNGVIDQDIYNYLADAEHRRNRLQVAAVLPLFLRCLALRADVSPYLEMRGAVDQGLPLVDAACQAMRVTPSAMRCVIGRDVSICGESWEDAPDTLVRLLDSIRPEARPQADPESWKRLRDLVDLAEQQIGRRISESFLGWAWVRETLQAGAKSARRGAEALSDSRSVAAVESLRDELIRVVELQSRTPGTTQTAAQATAIKASVDGFLRTRTVRRVIATGMQWQQEYAAARAERDDLMEFLRGARYWPLLPAAHVSADKSRRIVPLANGAQVQAHGVAMGICLAGSQLPAYDAACRKGRAFLLAILDGETDRPLSTVELKVSRPRKNVAMHVSVVQHTARANAAPSEACRRALRELIPVFTGESVQRHLRLGLIAMDTFRERVAEPGHRAELLAKIRAFRRTLGDAPYEALVASHAAAPLVGSVACSRSGPR